MWCRSHACALRGSTGRCPTETQQSLLTTRAVVVTSCIGGAGVPASAVAPCACRWRPPPAQAHARWHQERRPRSVASPAVATLGGTRNGGHARWHHRRSPRRAPHARRMRGCITHGGVFRRRRGRVRRADMLHACCVFPHRFGAVGHRDNAALCVVVTSRAGCRSGAPRARMSTCATAAQRASSSTCGGCSARQATAAAAGATKWSGTPSRGPLCKARGRQRRRRRRCICRRRLVWSPRPRALSRLHWCDNGSAELSAATRCLAA